MIRFYDIIGTTFFHYGHSPTYFAICLIYEKSRLCYLCLNSGEKQYNIGFKPINRD